MELQTLQKERADDLLTVHQAAQIAGRCHKTIRRWIYDSHLKAQKGGGAYGRYRIRRGDLAEALEYNPDKRTDKETEDPQEMLTMNT